MTTIVGKYVRTFAEADMGMLDGVSLNAPYDFHWLYLTEVGEDYIVCKAGRETKRLAFKRTKRGDRATVVVDDPLFGPLPFSVHPFLREGARAVGPQLGLFGEG